MGILKSIPLMALVVLSYVIFATTGLGDLSASVLQFELLSGDQFSFTLAECHVAVGLLLLFLEIVKSTGTGTATIIDHGFSLALFIGCLILFLVIKTFGTSTFLLITIMSLVDVLAGFTVTIVAARRDIAVGPDGGGYHR